MSVYIKGMEMPTSCYKCPLKRREGMTFVCPVTHETFSVADVNILDYRLDNCPIISIPEHGELWEAPTNADRIRAMTDGELAKWLCVMNIDDCPDRAHQMKCTDKCYECWLDWLKSPVEDDK